MVNANEIKITMFCFDFPVLAQITPPFPEVIEQQDLHPKQKSG